MMRNYFGNMMGWCGGYGGGGSGWLGGLFSLAFWVLIIVGIVFLIKWLAGQSHKTNEGGKTPADILKARYAKGEISKEEFEKMKKDLE